MAHMTPSADDVARIEDAYRSLEDLRGGLARFDDSKAFESAWNSRSVEERAPTLVLEAAFCNIQNHAGELCAWGLHANGISPIGSKAAQFDQLGKATPELQTVSHRMRVLHRFRDRPLQHFRQRTRPGNFYKLAVEQAAVAEEWLRGFGAAMRRLGYDL